MSTAECTALTYISGSCSVSYTSFITFFGVYQFTRLFFGPKRAPSYFQEIMATVVLTCLIYMICEMYIDDCTVFGYTNIEFVSRLKLIFERFRKHNLYIKASKCLFGYSELEFVGKVMSEKGLQISRTKIQSVLDFPLPTVSKQLKSFWKQRTISETLLKVIQPSVSHCISL